MLIIGICGQTGAGKSTLANMLAARGFGENLEVDAIGHQLLQDLNVKKLLVEQFGDEIVAEDGAICRRSLGRKAFCDSTATGRLNSIMHPAMIERVRSVIDSARAAGKSALIVNAALLFSMGLNALCNRLVYVRARPEIRMARLVDLRNWTEASARERLFAQDEMPADPAILVIDNNGSEKELAEAADALVPLLNQGN